ncbi:hypothetical protein TNCV_2620441 [Trichonephila clavipes]|uniref:CCHC-type domain-containing protein n=1 Tax=Trichonephila clavipes TaxID=2585209 RepID=A0A8X7BIR2_TRICX|nr:hypothetical protein TNCV_2620441 [Trichonephila clavipes]
MEPFRNSSSIEEQQIVPDSARYFIMRTTETFSKVSPFLIEKAISGSIGAVKTIRKMRSGDLFIEVSSSQQASALTKLRHLATIDVTVVAHRSLNYSRGVITAADLLHVSTEEILENLQDQKSVKAAYLNCPVRPYIPNPLRCFQCQRFGHSKLTCRGQATCARCAEVGHDSADCKAREKCVNCKGDHTSYSRSCPNWSLEKEITALKIKNKISYPEARRIVSSRTPVTGVSYAAVVKTTQISASTQYNLDDLKNQTPLSPVKSSHKKLVITDKTVSKTSTPKPSHKKRIERLKDSKLQTRSDCEEFMTSFISWNCRGLRTRLVDLKSIISTYQPACVALQETFLKSTMTMRVRGYNCVRRDVDGDTSPTGGVCLFTSNLYPSTVVTLHTSLQAVAVRIHIHSLVTVCCVYLPPNDVVPQVD